MTLGDVSGRWHKDTRYGTVSNSIQRGFFFSSLRTFSRLLNESFNISFTLSVTDSMDPACPKSVSRRDLGEGCEM